MPGVAAAPGWRASFPGDPIAVAAAALPADVRVVTVYHAGSLEAGYAALLEALAGLYRPPGCYRGAVLVLTDQAMLAGQVAGTQQPYHAGQERLLARVERARAAFTGIEVRYVTADYVLGYSCAVAHFLARYAQVLEAAVTDVDAARALLAPILATADPGVLAHLGLGEGAREEEAAG